MEWMPAVSLERQSRVFRPDHRPVPMAFARFPPRPKRKEIDAVAEDFSDFSLSAPAVKMRRLDADVPLNINLPEVQSSTTINDFDIIQEKPGAITSPVQYSDPNDTMALVLYKPPNIPGGLPGVSFTIDSNLLANIKNMNQTFWSNDAPRETDDVKELQEATDDNKRTAENPCLAVVPWLPSQISEVNGTSGGQRSPMEDQMEFAEEVDAMSMDVDEDMGQVLREEAPAASSSASVAGPPFCDPFSSLQQWQQQHCMFPDVAPNASTPLTWSR